MNVRTVIALDMMGGDFAPTSTLGGAKEALEAWPDLGLLLVGHEPKLRHMMGHTGFHESLLTRAEVVHAASVIDNHDKAISVLRDKKDSSIRIAAQLVREGRAHGVVTMGHTGAAMVSSKVVIGSLPGVDRPCLASVMPNAKGGRTVLLDVGANVDSKPEHLVQFALMGGIYAEEVLGIAQPRIGILSVGEEESKGNETTKEAFQFLRSLDVNFQGNAEGRDIWNGHFDVIACDGFVGNALLKSSEGLAEGIFKVIKESLGSSPMAKLGALFARSALRQVHKKLDYTEFGGAPLLGVKGISIIGHGRSDGRTVRNAIRAARQAVDARINEHIQEKLEKLLL